jgi:Protein of unknown function (DUF3179)
MQNKNVVVFLIAALTGLTIWSVRAQEESGGELKYDTRFKTVPLERLASGGPPPNGIPPLGFAQDAFGFPDTKAVNFETLAQAKKWLKPREPVILVRLSGDAAIVPLQVLVWHEIANFTLGKTPVAVTFCPLCNTAVAMDRRIPINAAMRARLKAVPSAPKPEGDFLLASFGVSGLLYNSAMVMFDSATHTLWSQAIAQGIVGTLSGTELKVLPSQIMSFEAASRAAPNARVVSRNTGYSRNYGQNPYVGYDDATNPPFLFKGPTDGRLPPKERVVSLSLNGIDVAYPWSILQQRRVINDRLGETPITVFWTPGTTSALNESSIADSRDVGASGVFDRRIGNRVLTFESAGDAWRDRETGSTWSLVGEATTGPLKGQRLEPVAHTNHFWFAWAAFKPNTRIFK